MTFSYQITADPSIDPALVKDADYALEQWSNALDGKGTLIVNLRVLNTPVGRADADVTGVAASTANGRTITLSSAAYELTTGTHATSLPDGSGADVVVNFSPSYLQNVLYIDPDPSSSIDIPSNKTDAVSVIEHELGHALGIDGYYPLAASSPANLGAFESVFDSFVQFPNGLPVFTGPNAEAANGGNPVPLTAFPLSNPESSQNIYHVGMSLTDPFGNDLMTGAYYQNGFRYVISPLDVAIVQDASGLSRSLPPVPSQPLPPEESGCLVKSGPSDDAPMPSPLMDQDPPGASETIDLKQHHHEGGREKMSFMLDGKQDSAPHGQEHSHDATRDFTPKDWPCGSASPLPDPQVLSAGAGTWDMASHAVMPICDSNT